MCKKKILVIIPANIIPINMGSQVRIYNLIKSLSRLHHVDVIARVTNKKYLSSEYTREIENICDNYYPILAPNKKNLLNRMYYLIFRKVKGIPKVFFNNSIFSYTNQILKIVNTKKYDIINCEYWYACSFYKGINYRPYLVLDTHNILFEKYGMHLNKDNRQKLNRYIRLEMKHIKLNDLIISISENDYKFFRSLFPGKQHLKIPAGRELNSFLNYTSSFANNNTILFYGNFLGAQNIKGFLRLFNNIIPKIHVKNYKVKLVVLGANPPKDLIKLHDGNGIFITGHVNDVREWISKTSLMILPLEIAGGFRTRIVEVMAMGIPVIGTHNALDCIEMENGVHGFITDSDEEMANYTIQILNDHHLREKMFKECKKFVTEKYSIEATYCKLSKFYSELEVNK